MLNKGVLALNVPVPGLRAHFMLTKTLEWNIYWWVVWWRWVGRGGLGWVGWMNMLVEAPAGGVGWGGVGWGGGPE